MTENQEQTSTGNKKKSKSQLFHIFASIFKVVLFLALIAAIAWGTWSYKMYLDVKGQLTKLSSLEGQQQLAQQEVQKVVNQVKKHIILPEDEEPVIATVTNAEALSKEQPFYVGAKNDDKVLIYPKAGKAIIYSPSADLIVNVGPVYIEQPQSSEQSNAKPTPTTAAEKVTSPSPASSPATTAQP